MSSSVLKFRLSPGARLQFGIFLGAYLLYSAARYITVGDLSSAQAHAEWIVNLERSLGVYTEAAFRRGSPARRPSGSSTTSTSPPS